MRTYLISYDLAKPHLDKHVVAQAIMTLGASWARPLEQTWYVRSEEGEETIAGSLWGLLDDNDGLLIQQVKDEAVLMNTSLRWFRKRRPGIDVDATSNIIAFPSSTPPAAQSEFPFAEAC
jgi:hypothetical protein